MKWHATLMVAIVGSCGGGVSAAEEDGAVLRFADMNGIRNWRVDEQSEQDAILIEGRNGDWFRATFFGSCPEIRFTEGLGFVTDRLGNLDRFTSIIARGHQCYFRTFERTDDPEEGSGDVQVEPRER